MSIKNYFIPTERNNFHPYLIRKTSLVIFALILFAFNMTVGRLPTSQVSAAVLTSGLVELHNRERANRGLSSLSVNSLLINSATNKARAMLDSDCWSHYCPNGKSPWTFFQEEGYSYVYAGENLAEGFTDNETVMNAWMNSPTHKANIVKPEFREIGIGIAHGPYQGNPNNVIVVVHFGTQVDSNFNLPDPPQATPAPTKTADVIPPDAPLITSPINGGYTNDELFPITGKVNEDSTIQIFDNNVPKGQIISNGGIFDYRPPAETPFTEGSHIIYVQAIDIAGNTSDRSEEVNVTLDTIAPVVSSEFIEILSTNIQNQLRIRIEIADELSSLTLQSAEDAIEFVHVPNSGFWEADINKEFFNNESVKITAVDKATNVTTTEIRSSQILGSIDKVNLQISSNLGNTDLLTLIISRELPSLRNAASLIFTLFILFLFLLDAFILAKTHIPSEFKVRGKSRFHISSLLIIILIVLIGGFSGNILNGIAL